MKKEFILVFIFLLLFSGCGKKEEKTENEVTTGQIETESVITCSLSKSGAQFDLSTTYTIYHDGRYVNYSHVVTHLFSSNSSLLNQTYKSENDNYKRMNDKYGGYDYDVSILNNKVVSDVKIYYSKMDLQKLVGDDPSLSKYIRNSKMLVEGLKELYISNGAVCE